MSQVVGVFGGIGRVERIEYGVWHEESDYLGWHEFVYPWPFNEFGHPHNVTEYFEVASPWVFESDHAYVMFGGERFRPADLMGGWQPTRVESITVTHHEAGWEARLMGPEVVPEPCGALGLVASIVVAWLGRLVR